MNWLRLTLTLLAGVLAFYPVVKIPTPGLLAIAGIALIFTAVGIFSGQYRFFSSASGFILLGHCLALMGRTGVPAGAEAILAGLGVFLMLELSYSVCLFPSHLSSMVDASLPEPGKGRPSGRHGLDSYNRMLLSILIRVIGIGFISMFFLLGFLILSRRIVIPGNLFLPALVLSGSISGLCIILLLRHLTGSVIDK